MTVLCFENTHLKMQSKININKCRLCLLNCARFTPIHGLFQNHGQCLQGADVMITIICDFLPNFGENFSVFLKNQCYDHIFAKLSVV
jgi:hypothetical protein